MFREGRAPNKQDKPSGMSRRNFLTGAIGLIGAAAAAGPTEAFGKTRKQRLEEKRNQDQMDRANDSIRRFQAIEQIMERECAKKGIPTKTYTPEVKAQLHDIAITDPEITEHMQKIFQNMHNDFWLVGEVRAELKKYGCSGFVDQYITDHPSSFSEIKSYLEYVSYTYGSYAKDYLPKSHVVSHHEIDPGPNETAAAERHMTLRQGWNSRHASRKFRDALDNPEIRKRIQASDCTIAEAYSAIKAAIKKTERNKDSDLVANIETVLAERSTFMQRELLGPETTAFIALTYSEPNRRQFDPAFIENLADAAHVAPDARHSICTEDVRTARAALTEAIKNSEGKTLIFFNTHGSEGSVAVAEAGDADITDAEIAYALLDRIIKSQKADSLAEMNIYLQSCFGTDFANNIVESMRVACISDPTIRKQLQELHIRWEDITLPTIVSASQEGRFGFSTKKFDQLLPHVTASGKLTGSFIMQVLQPADYSYADYTFLVGKKGAIEEFGALDTQTNHLG